MTDYCWFDYQYRDAGNWKTFRSLLLSGRPKLPADEDSIRWTLESGDLFVPEQVGLPPLQPEHLIEHGVDNYDGDDLDHAFHEFVGLRVAMPQEARGLAAAASLATLLRELEAAGREGWDVTSSPFGRW